MIKPSRTSISALAITGAMLVAWVTNEGYVEVANVPTKDDRCTNGFGSTFDEDGRPIQCGEKTDPVKALRRAYVLMEQKKKKLEKCITGEVSEVEAGLLFDFSGQYGETATCKSSMVKHINAGRYKEACEAYTLYKYAAGYDCSTPGNKRCYGSWERSMWRRTTCLNALNPESAPLPDTGAVARSGSGPTKEN